MKYFIFFIIFFLFCCNVYSQNYFPLAVGNKWQYYYSYYNNEDIASGIQRRTITRDTLISGKRYYCVQDSLPNSSLTTYQRYDSLENKVYRIYSGVEYVASDFNLKTGNILNVYISKWSFLPYSILRTTTSYFGETRNLYEMDCTSQQLKSLYVENCGLFSESEIAAHNYHYNSKILCYFIKDSLNNYSNWFTHEKVRFTHYSDVVLSKDISLTAYIADPYDCFQYHHNVWSIIELYTEKAGCEYYFVKDSVNSPVYNIIQSISDTVVRFNFSIPEAYFSPGVELVYRFKAINKNYIPDTNYSNWFTAVNVTGIEKLNELKKPSLSIYPNPAMYHVTIEYYWQGNQR